VTFSAALESEDGLEVVALRAGGLEARIAPHAGANLFSLKVDGIELLAQPASLAELATSPAGTPVLFPMPNRVRDGVFEFEGRKFSFEPNSGAHYIHGLVRRRPWMVEPLDAALSSASLSVEWDAAQPDFERFPLPHRLALTFGLHAGGLAIDYRVDNLGPERLPFGFGLHPWFRVPGPREDVRLQIPAAQRMETEDKLPSGRFLELDGTPFDLRRPTSLAGLDLDDVYVGLDTATPPSFEWREPGIRVTLGGSPEFTHLVVFTPPGRPVFCIENQTSSTDAHNLFARGLARESHLQIVEAGGSARGGVSWTIERVPSK
jgi:aldose 1-epimerase